MISSRSFSNRKVWSIMWNLSMYTKLVGKSLIHCPLVSFLEISICVESLCQIKCRLEGCKNIPSHHWMNFAYLENFHKKFAGSCETSRNFSIHKPIKVQYSPPGFHRLNPMPHQLSNYSISVVAVWAYRHYYSPPSFFYWNFISYMQHESLLTRISLPIVSINQPSSSRQ